MPKSKVISVRIVPWVFFRTKKLEGILGKTTSDIVQEALAVHFNGLKMSEDIVRKWIDEFHKENPDEVD